MVSHTPDPGSSSQHPVDEYLQVCSGVSRGRESIAWFASYILSILNNPKAESPTAYLDSKLGPDARPGNGSHGPPPQVAQLIMATESHSFFTSIYSVPFG